MGEIFIEHALISTLTGLFVQLLKRFNIKIIEEYTAIVSIIIGVIGNFGYAFALNPSENISWGSVLVGGIFAGMTASGAYDSFKNPIHSIKKKITQSKHMKQEGEK